VAEANLAGFSAGLSSLKCSGNDRNNFEASNFAAARALSISEIPEESTASGKYFRSSRGQGSVGATFGGMFEGGFSRRPPSSFLGSGPGTGDYGDTNSSLGSHSSCGRLLSDSSNILLKNNIRLRNRLVGNGNRVNPASFLAAAHSEFILAHQHRIPTRNLKLSSYLPSSFIVGPSKRCTLSSFHVARLPFLRNVALHGPSSQNACTLSTFLERVNSQVLAGVHNIVHNILSEVFNSKFFNSKFFNSELRHLLSSDSFSSQSFNSASFNASSSTSVHSPFFTTKRASTPTFSSSSESSQPVSPQQNHSKFNLPSGMSTISTPANSTESGIRNATRNSSVPTSGNACTRNATRNSSGIPSSFPSSLPTSFVVWGPAALAGDMLKRGSVLLFQSGKEQVTLAPMWA
jgi:hypothetical protein